MSASQPAAVPLLEEPERPQPSTIQPSVSKPTGKRSNHRGGKKKKKRRQSFASSAQDGLPEPPRVDPDDVARSSFYRLQSHNLSTTSIESEALQDHREQQSMRPRRSSTMGGMSMFGQPIYDSPSSYRPSYANPFVSSSENIARRGVGKKQSNDAREDEDMVDERAPLLSSSTRAKDSSVSTGYNAFGGEGQVPLRSSPRRPSSKSSSRSRHKNTIFDRHPAGAFPTRSDDYNVNHPPSMPGSPTLGAMNRGMSLGDLLVRDEFSPARAAPHDNDELSERAIDDYSRTSRDSPPHESLQRRHTIALQAQDDVCFPVEGMSELADDDMTQQDNGVYRSPRRRRAKWPDLNILEEWSRVEKEGRSEERRAKAITEPHLIGGRLRPTHKGWHRAEDDAPYRFTYFNEEFQSTIHSQTISELVQPGGGFKELFIPDRPVLSDSESESSEDGENTHAGRDDSHIRHVPGVNGDSRAPTRQGSVMDNGLSDHGPRSLKRDASPLQSEGGRTESMSQGREIVGSVTPVGMKSPPSMKPQLLKPEKPKRYGERPTWWLDVLSPTQAEMQVISKAFGIHPLTSEDILMQEPREKVELFRNYYFVNYRSFEQDMHSEDFLEPINMYVVVFREGVISFHFSMTPHPANVRRRIRQLKDYLILSSDWISYAIIDDITDVFAPLIQNIEEEVDDIDDAILMLHSPSEEEKKRSSADSEKRLDSGDGTGAESGVDMLRRVGDCRKKVMGLYRLLGNKADVIKGFAKRCNEQWDVAPRSEIGLYLGDIQDHIVTMTGNLSHYEKILARAHGNYLAQINIRMNERQEQTADVLGKLTVLGTIVLPMNIITGLWGMNVWVPGQDKEGDLTWFWCLTAGLLLFGLSCFFTARWLYRIV